ncbi:hypothetical protein QCA50_000861 [Cerrena zonata]|uniref:CxC2-like cysteine cluster KDZ transposase-associated domain-containing protein n=1 Tax=Cerrena zonata TaxID=2478898 RepID=A0AAW0GRL2_9APHY
MAKRRRSLPSSQPSQSSKRSRSSMSLHPVVIEDLTRRRKRSTAPTGHRLTHPNLANTLNHSRRRVLLSSPDQQLFPTPPAAFIPQESAQQAINLDGIVFEHDIAPERPRKNATSYLRSWLPQRDVFLAEIIERTAPPPIEACSVCGLAMEWRCDDCFGAPCFCTRCCRTSHQISPFHRVSRWTGNTFIRSSLRNTGLILYMGHNGRPCNQPVDGEEFPHTTPFHSTTTSRASSTHSSPLLPSNPLPDVAQRSGCATTHHDQITNLDMIDDSRPDLFEPFDLSQFGAPRSASPASPPPMSSPLTSPTVSHLSSLSQHSSPASSISPSPSISTRTLGVPDESSPEPFDRNDDSASHIQDMLFEDDLDANEGDDDIDFETGGISISSLKYPKGFDSHGNQWMTIVDITGVHHLPVHFCSCQHHAAPHIQLLRLGLYPASHDRPQTVFTFRVLDDFDLDNLETKASAQRYYAKIRRLTSNPFPQSVPDRYREFMRVVREWRNLKQRKRAGVHYSAGHEGERGIKEGGLAIFCPACPQPGVNLPEDWAKEDDQWRFMRTLLADGNFKQEHLKMKNPEDDVPLSDGHGYFVAQKGFDEYIKKAPPLAYQKSTCHEHDAVKSQNNTRAHLDATGIGAIACGRHGCFYPHSVVNFQKGEGYRYMDYSFINAINYIPMILLLLLLYDIMCQYWPNFLTRCDAVQHLIRLNDSLVLKRGIGLFHVHGHVKECYPRYAPSFIPGAGMLDGEIIETLWHILNDTASSGRSMSWFHRQEYLDTHMYDSNWKKLIRMVPSLCRKWRACLEQTEDSDDYFQKLSEHVGATRAAQWTADEQRMQTQRDTNVEVMDEFDVREVNVPRRADIQKDIAEQEEQSALLLGSSAWVAMGLKIEEEQLGLLNVMRKARAQPITYERQIALQAKRRRLQGKIDTFMTQSAEYLGTTGQVPTNLIDDDWFNEDDDRDDSMEGVLSGSDIPAGESISPETISLPLPSSYGTQTCHERLSVVAQCELQLRVGQANDALHDLRVAIAHKSFVYRSRIRKNSPTTGYAKRLRSYGDAHAVQMTIDHAAKVYITTRKAMIVLGADRDILSKYKPLNKTDLAASTAVADSNARGQRRDQLSWIWQTFSNTNSPDFMNEMLRVNWLRAKSRRDRWREEKILLRSEIDWTRIFYQRQVDLWIDRSADVSRGAHCHALRQADTWRRFVYLAQKAQTKIMI